MIERRVDNNNDYDDDNDDETCLTEIAAKRKPNRRNSIVLRTNLAKRLCGCCCCCCFYWPSLVRCLECACVQALLYVCIGQVNDWGLLWSQSYGLNVATPMHQTVGNGYESPGERPFDDGWTFLLGWGCLNGQMNDYMVKWPIDWLDFECHTNKNNTKQTNKQTANKQKTNKQQTANIKHWTTEITISEAFRDHKYAKKIINMVAHARFTHILMAFSQL